MNVIPLRRPQAPSPARIALRRDLRSNVIASGAVDACSPDADDELRAWAKALAAATHAWTAARLSAPLAIAPPPRLYGDAIGAGELLGTLRSAGYAPDRIDVEVSEAALAVSGLGGVERLRASGFGVALAVDPACSLPLGQRERSLFTEYLVPAPRRVDPYLACEGWENVPLAGRVFAANAAGIPVTAVGVDDPVWARALLSAGFCRSEGAYAGAL